jgi:mono/diheme cytochrome c family protein
MLFRKFNEWRKRPAEEQTYRFPFFVTIVLLILLTLWSVWDETFRRRPWKDYQNEFFRLELSKADSEYQERKKEFESAQTQKIYQDLRERIKILKQGPENPLKRKEYFQAKDRLNELKFKLEDFARDSQFTKSRFDAAYYLYEKAILEKSSNLEKRKQAIDRLQQKLDGFSQEIKAVEGESAPLWKIVQAHDEEIFKAETDFNQMTLDLEMLKKKVSEVKKKSPKIEQIVVKDLNRVDRCQTCHLAIDRPGFEDPEKYPQPFRTHPKLDALLKKHPPEKFGCTICHGGQGPALTVKDAHGEIHHWAFPLLRDRKVESSCQQCHATVQVSEAPQLTQGKMLFETLGCGGCHLAPGFEEAVKVGPELNRIHEKTTLRWLEQWIEKPRSFSSTTRMPQFKITQEESNSIAHYLASLSETQPMTEEEKTLIAKGSPEEGRKLFSELACIACHRVGEEGQTFAPNLSSVGSKVRPEWLVRWLKNPRKYLPHGKMPNMRLEEGEMAHLVSYLVSLKKGGMDFTTSTNESIDPNLAEKGKKLIANLGCTGCHVIPGFENQPRVGAELTNFGGKDLTLLYFGYAEHIPHSLWDWTFHKIKDPQIYATERIEQKMPNFYLSDEESNALVTLVTSFRADQKQIPLHYRKALNDKEKAIEDGRNIVRDLNCVGCHMIEGKGSDIAPTLAGEGEKVQPEWMFKFLKNPISIRPWLNVRMPKFNLTDEKTSRLVSYFSALSDAPYPFEFFYFNDVQVPERERKAGEKLFEMFKCMSCHPVSMDPAMKGSQVVNLGPNLGLAKDRLRHDWIARWILEPEVIQPGTKMPTNFPKMGEKRISYVPNLLKSPQYQELKKYFEDLFGSEAEAFLNDPAWQTRAIRDHVVSLERERVLQTKTPESQLQTQKEPLPAPPSQPSSTSAQEEEEW